MARKRGHRRKIPITKPSGRQGVLDRIWQAIRELAYEQGQWTQDDVATRARAPEDTVQQYVSALARTTYVRCVSAAQPTPSPAVVSKTYVLDIDAGVHRPVTLDGKPRAEPAKTAMWRTMRVLKRFSVDALLATLAGREKPVSRDRAQRWCQVLHRAGYLRQIGDHKPGAPGRRRYMMVRDTGPAPPVVQRLVRVVDANTDEVVWTGGGG